MGVSQIKSDVTIHFLVGGLVIHFAGNFHLSCSVQNFLKEFHACAFVTIFFQFLGANMTHKNLFANIETPKRHFLEKICVNSGIMVQVAIPVRAVGLPQNKEKK
jgi:hypothetical protein